MRLLSRGQRGPATISGADASALDQATAAGYGDLLRFGSPKRRSAVRGRALVLLGALGVPINGPSDDDIAIALARALRSCRPEFMWLALAVLTANLPDTSAVLRVTRAAHLEGAGVALLAEIEHLENSQVDESTSVQVVEGTVLSDIDHTARTSLNTGIQRVARETMRRWTRDHDVLLVAWTNDYKALRKLTERETDVALRGQAAGSLTIDTPREVVVPWRCTVVLPELAAERTRASRLQALAAFSGSSTGLIGFDCVPIMAAETSAEGMASAFASYLAAAAHFDRVAAISESAAIEYQGWRTMLAGAGLTGPQITPIELPAEAHHPSAEALDETSALLGQGAFRIVLAVGSHEPRKNHLAVLQAADTLWREGLAFALVFIGGNSWKSARFTERLAAPAASNRPVLSITALPDEMLWAAYRLAYCTVFPSLHEGFGLPVAESLASGTPVITSNFGSMMNIATHDGAILVDPRDDADLTSALRQLLLDDTLRNGLAAEASHLPRRTWDEYAAETWAYLIEGES